MSGPDHFAHQKSEVRQNELPNGHIGIYDENHRLTKVAMWGPVGTEAVLAQLFPPHISLFFDQMDQMDVVKARDETYRFAETLTSHGVEIITVRDELARLIPKKPLDKQTVRDKLIAKANDIQSTYQIDSPGCEDAIELLLEEDISRYGEEAALNLNAALSLNPNLPLGNSIFARDQANVIMGRRIRSNMAEPIRIREVSLYEMVYHNVGLTHPLTIPKGETFEGGDAYIHDGVVYVGVGVRTSFNAAMSIYQGLKDELEEKAFRFALVVRTADRQETHADTQKTMHLDTFSTPLGPKEILICEKEACKRRLYFVKDGQIIDQQQTFADHLREEGNSLLVIPESEQQNFGANLLALDDKTMFVPLDTNTHTINGLTGMGKQVISLNLQESTKGYGAAHCMIFQLKRC